MNQNLISQITALSDEALGTGYFTGADLAKALKSENQKLLLIREGEIIKGFSLIKILFRESASKDLFLSPADLNILFKEVNKIGYRKMTVVGAQYQGQGFSADLFEAGRQWFLSKNADVVLSTYWADGQNDHYGEFLKSKGFSLFKRVPEYWRKDSVTREFICPVCGPPPCQCAANVMVMRSK